MKLVTSAQMRALEQRAVDAGVPIDALMEAAGLAVAQETWLMLGSVEERRIVVLAGPGNNGGDGLVAARHLADWQARVTVYVPLPRQAPDPHLDALRERGVDVHIAGDPGWDDTLRASLGDAEIVVDALLGTGASRAIDGAMADALRALAECRARPGGPRIVAVDLPSGIDADSGRADSLAVAADLTVTFGLAKVGLHMLPGSEFAGRIEVVDIGIPAAACEDVRLELLSAPWVRARLPARPPGGNKGTFGRVLVVAGSQWYVGAARLAAEACYRAGAGLVTIACPQRLQAMIAPALPEATWLPLDDAPALRPSSVSAIVDALADYDVLLIGPGLGQDAGVRDAVTSILSRAPENVRACVVDADALNALAHHDKWHERIARPCVFTPHPGEMARLRASDVAAVQSDRLNIATDAASAWGHVVVLKGAHTVVAGPDGRATLSPHANPLLATAGTGDVLTGAIAALIAQGAEPFDAAAAGVFVHGLAAEEAGDELGDRGMLAGDLLPAIPRAIRALREGKRARPTPAFDFGGFESLFSRPEGGG